MMDQKVAGAFVSPISITVYSYNPYRVLNAVSHLYPFTIRIQQNLSQTSNFVNYLAPQSRSISSYISNKGYQFFLVALFSYLQSIQSRSLLFFLGTKSTREAIRLLLSRINPFLRFFSRYCISSSYQSYDIRYIRPRRNFALSSK